MLQVGILIAVYSANNWLASLADAFNRGECLNLKGTPKQIKV